MNIVEGVEIPEFVSDGKEENLLHPLPGFCYKYKGTGRETRTKFC